LKPKDEIKVLNNDDVEVKLGMIQGNRLGGSTFAQGAKVFLPYLLGILAF
jgi:hypothetical protein